MWPRGGTTNRPNERYDAAMATTYVYLDQGPLCHAQSTETLYPDDAGQKDGIPPNPAGDIGSM